MCIYAVWYTDTRLSVVYKVDTNFSHAQLKLSGVLEFSVSDDYMFAVKDHVSYTQHIHIMVCNFSGSLLHTTCYLLWTLY